MNWSHKPCTGHPTLIPFVALEDSLRAGMTSKLHRRKRKDHKPVVCVERIPGNLTRADITGLPGALNEVGGILMFPARAHTSRYSSRDCPAEFIE
jgi:hypothetical protein